MSRRRGGRNNYVSHLASSKQVQRSSIEHLKAIYPDFYRRGAMRDREERLQWKHKIGRATGIDPETGRKYREPFSVGAAPLGGYHFVSQVEAQEA